MAGEIVLLAVIATAFALTGVYLIYVRTLMRSMEFWPYADPMCGRYTNHATWAEVHAFTTPLAVATPALDPEPAYNIAASQNAWAILARDGQTVAERLRWGHGTGPHRFTA